MIMWAIAYFISLVVLHGNCASLFRTYRQGDKPTGKALAGILVGFYLCILSLSILVIREAGIRSDELKIASMILGFVPVTLSVYLAKRYRFRDERLGTDRGMYF
ncbi:hypothetical protein [Corallincola platygyrae]|uniref:hypothetical protein n=1 Tax=Corallincola platygyrae TaxID=1193278 RepID=UPI0031F1BD2B